MNTTLMPNEQLDKLPDCNLSIIQNKEMLCYGSDALFLSEFAVIHNKDSVVDLCTGNGIIPLLLASKSKAKIKAVELQKEVAELAERNIQLNNLQNQIQIYNGDIRNIEKFIDKNSATVVTANPPYMKALKVQNENKFKNIARHEVECTIDDVTECASKLLNSSGCFYLIHRPGRLSEIFSSLKKHNLEPKRMKFIYPDSRKSPEMVLIESKKNARPELIIEPPLFMYK